MKYLIIFYLFIFSSILSACHSKKNDNLTIACAANVQFAMEEILPAFTKETGIKCNKIISSSGKLTAQIQAGAPYDVFISADIKYPEEIEKAGFAANKPQIYAYGRLVMWSLKEGVELNSELLKGENVRHIAIANPKTAPYGVAAMEVLDQMGAMEEVENKIVYGESISQVNQFVLSETADIGFTSKSTVLSPELKTTGQWVEISSVLYTPISQGVVVIQNENSEKAIKFYNFLLSSESKKILGKYGYSTTIEE